LVQVGDNYMNDMTKEIAFNLGGFLYPNFYGNMYKSSKDFEDYNNFFDFSDITSGYGVVKKEAFNTLAQKLWYVRGAISGFAVEITNSHIKLSYANAHHYRELLNSFVKDLYYDFFIAKLLMREDSEECERGITLGDSLTTTPCIFTWCIKAEKEFISHLLDMEEFYYWNDSFYKMKPYFFKNDREFIFGKVIV